MIFISMRGQGLLNTKWNEHDVKLAGQLDCGADFQIFYNLFRPVPQVPQNEATFTIYIQLFN